MFDTAPGYGASEEVAARVAKELGIILHIGSLALKAPGDRIANRALVFAPDGRVIAANALASEFGGHPPGTLRPGRSLDELIAARPAVAAGPARARRPDPRRR